MTILYSILTENQLYLRNGKITISIPLQELCYPNILLAIMQYTTKETSKIIFGWYNEDVFNDFIFFVTLLSRKDPILLPLLSIDREFILNNLPGEEGVKFVKKPMVLKNRIKKLRNLTLELREMANLQNSVNMRLLSQNMLKHITGIEECVSYYES